MFSYHGQRDNLTPMAIITATLDPVSIAQIDANCKMLSGDVVRQICLEVLKEVSDPILEYAIVCCPVGNPKKDIFAGLLKKSIDRKSKKLRDGAYVVVGPARKRGVDTGRNQMYGTDLKRLGKKGLRLQNPNIKLPTRYAHFIEWGTSKMAPKPFMRPAWDTAGGDVALNSFMSKFAARLGQATAGMSTSP